MAVTISPVKEPDVDSPFRNALNKTKEKYEEAKFIIMEQEEPPSSIFFDQSVGTSRGKLEKLNIDLASIEQSSSCLPPYPSASRNESNTVNLEQ